MMGEMFKKYIIEPDEAYILEGIFLKALDKY